MKSDLGCGGGWGAGSRRATNARELKPVMTAGASPLHQAMMNKKIAHMQSTDSEQYGVLPLDKVAGPHYAFCAPRRACDAALKPCAAHTQVVVRKDAKGSLGLVIGKEEDKVHRACMHAFFCWPAPGRVLVRFGALIRPTHPAQGPGPFRVVTIAPEVRHLQLAPRKPAALHVGHAFSQCVGGAALSRRSSISPPLGPRLLPVRCAGACCKFRALCRRLDPRD